MVSNARIRPAFSPVRCGPRWALGPVAVALLATMAWFVSDAFGAQSPVGLGTADSFAVLAGSTVTNTGPSTINGDLGVAPGTALTGFTGPPEGTVNGTVHSADAVAGQAQTDLTTAYNDAAGRTPPVSLASAELGGRTLTPGVYRSPTLGLTGALTLDAQGNPNAVFIFQAGSTLITGVGSQVNLINGAQPCNVFWKVGSSATLGTSSIFTGNILALTSISINDRVTVAGRALARNGAVTLINDTITAAHCAIPNTGGSGGTGGTGGTGGSGGSGGGSGGGGGGTSSGGTTVGSHSGSAHFGGRRTAGGKSRIVVTGHLIHKVVFKLGGKVIPSSKKAPWVAFVRPTGGLQTVTARVTFTDRTPALTLTMRFRSHTAAHHAPSPSKPLLGQGGFTG